MVMVIYFLMLRPQMKQQKERKKMLENLKKGDKIITSGGIYGTIAGFKGNNSIVILDIDKNVTIKISKSAISGSQSIDEKKD
ncbi:MAG: preprotein translocase subunit YajC [Candidatus Marinimicrobia bacterium]|nr:preprotein translocase subunit YajC [Candidatus Neomarinimicrobiota bacterium]OUW50483.1 MAG: preprotein translocase subunit YajC [bacterium TMED190]